MYSVCDKKNVLWDKKVFNERIERVELWYIIINVMILRNLIMMKCFVISIQVKVYYLSIKNRFHRYPDHKVFE